MEYHRHIEALVFAAQAPITVDEIKHTLETAYGSTVEPEVIIETASDLMRKYNEGDYAFQMVNMAEGYQFLTKGAYQPVIGTLLRISTRKRLSRAALEALSMIAYKQPVSRTEIDKIRGVNSDYSIQKLLEKGLIEILGRSDSAGRPLLYGTSKKFMDYLGISSLKELPQLKDYDQPDSEIGTPSPIEEEVPNSESPQPGSPVEDDAVHPDSAAPTEANQAPSENDDNN